MPRPVSMSRTGTSYGTGMDAEIGNDDDGQASEFVPPHRRDGDRPTVPAQVKEDARIRIPMHGSDFRYSAMCVKPGRVVPPSMVFRMCGLDVADVIGPTAPNDGSRAGACGRCVRFRRRQRGAARDRRQDAPAHRVVLPSPPFEEEATVGRRFHRR